ncbi:hypothetical protein CAEBREN_17176 [Caenorhabditis brenneri]|uniref:Decapping nuclease n=1 Tax=Caenorhabditis brenneri TaxID=135651 RepID=G0NJ30_CAEBE|nr:hypothetical protein CAEBREN_17176 [Caenorhabditis brenneri]
MPVVINVRKIGTFTKLADKTTIPDGLPPRLNERYDLYGPLEENMDLTLGFEDFKDEGRGDRFHSFFDYLKRTSKPGSVLKEVINADFVSNRRNLQVLARTPYYREDFEIQAIRQNGVIFLCDKNLDKEDRQLPYGYKFEQNMTLDKDGNTRSKYEKVCNKEATKAVLRTTIASGNQQLKVLYAAEMDAIDSKGTFVELKTTAMKHRKWLEKASLNEYLQSYLGGVQSIIYGRKISWTEPIVFRTDTVHTENIPKMGVNWDKNTCFDALFNILSKINSKLEYDEEALVVKISEEGVFFEPEVSNNCTFIDPAFLDHFA